MAKIGPGGIQTRAIGIVYAHSQDVAGQKVAGKLDALKRAVEGLARAWAKSRLAHAGHVFNQQMAFRQQGDKRELNHVFLAVNRAGNRALQL